MLYVTVPGKPVFFAKRGLLEEIKLGNPQIPNTEAAHCDSPTRPAHCLSKHLVPDIPEKDVRKAEVNKYSLA